MVDIFDQIQNYFIHIESDLIENADIQISYSNLFLLTELFLNQYTNDDSLPVLAKKLYLPYPTLVSKMNKLIKDRFLKKDNGVYVFPSSSKHLIDNFIALRTISYYETMRLATQKEEMVVLKVFDLLKTYALNTLSTN